MFWALQELVGPGEHAVVTVPNYQSMESLPLATGAAVSGPGARPEDGWALDLDALAALLRPDHAARRRQLPEQPDRRAARPGHLGGARRAVRGARDQAVLRRGLPRARAGRHAAAPTGRRPLADRAVARRDVARPTGCRGCGSAGSPAATARVLERLETRKHYTSICNAGAQRADRRPRAAPRRRDHRAQPRDHRRATCRCSRRSSRRTRRRFAWEPPQAGCVCFPRYLGADGVEAFCRDLVEQAGVVLLPASIYASELGEVPPDRFRIGVGRADPEPALEALERLPGPARRREPVTLRALDSGCGLGSRPIRQLRAHATRDGRAVRRRVRRRPRRPGRTRGVLAGGRRLLRRRPPARGGPRRARGHPRVGDRAGDPRARADPRRPAAPGRRRRGAPLPAARDPARPVPARRSRSAPTSTPTPPRPPTRTACSRSSCRSSRRPARAPCRCGTRTASRDRDRHPRRRRRGGRHGRRRPSCPSGCRCCRCATRSRSPTR